MFNLQNKLSIRIVFILGFILILCACENRPRGVLSQNNMANVLIDMHLIDASLSEKGLNYSHYSTKASYYNYILKKNGVTQAEFDSSLVWYTKNPKRFENVYIQVNEKLTRFQKEIRNGKYHPVDTLELGKVKSNIWNKRVKYALTKDSVRTHLDFEIINYSLMYRDAYVLKFLQQVAQEDSSKNQRIVLRIQYENGKTDSVSKPIYNDSLLRRYTIRMTAFRKLKIKSISGQLLGSSAYKGKLNALLDSITLTREFYPANQDSLRRMVEKKIPTKAIMGTKPALNSRNTSVFEKFKKLFHPK